MKKIILAFIFIYCLLISFVFSSAIFAPTNSIIDLNASLSNDGNILVGVKCFSVTQADLNIINMQTGVMIPIEPTTINCETEWITYSIKLLSKVSENNLVTIQTDIEKYSPECKACAKQVFVNYHNYSSQESQPIPDNNYFSLMTLLALVVIVLLKKRI
jgi:hypothetical protein